MTIKTSSKKPKIRLNRKSLEKEFGPMTVGLFLRAFREADNQSQSEFAAQLGVSKANLCDLEKGRKQVSVERAAKFAKILGVPEEGLIQIAFQDLLRMAQLPFRVEVTAA